MGLGEKALCSFALVLLAGACNALLGIDEAGPIQGSGGDASAGSSGSGGGGSSGLGGAGGSAGSVDAATCDADVSSDSNHCGACGHSCHGDPCVASKCLPSLVRSVDFNLYYLTVTADQIFATAGYGSAVVRIPKSDYLGIETWFVTQVGYDAFGPVAVFGQDVYFSFIDGRRIYRANASALGTPEVIYQDPADVYASDVVADSSGIYYDTCDSGIFKLTNGSPQQISPTPSCAFRLAIDADALWATSANEGSLFRIEKTPGGTVAEFVAAPTATDSYALWVEQTHVYFATYEEIPTTSEYRSRLYRVAKNAPAGTTPESLQSGDIIPTISDLTVADGFLYFVSSGTDAGAYKDGRILRVPLASPHQTPEVVAGDRGYPLAVAVDDQFVYWIDAVDPAWGPAEIWRVAK